MKKLLLLFLISAWSSDAWAELITDPAAFDAQHSVRLRFVSVKDAEGNPLGAKPGDLIVQFGASNVYGFSDQSGDGTASNTWDAVVISADSSNADLGEGFDLIGSTAGTAPPPLESLGYGDVYNQGLASLINNGNSALTAIFSLEYTLGANTSIGAGLTGGGQAQSMVWMDDDLGSSLLSKYALSDTAFGGGLSTETGTAFLELEVLPGETRGFTVLSQSTGAANIAAVPEPSTLVTMAGGGATLGVISWWRGRRERSRRSGSKAGSAAARATVRKAEPAPAHPLPQLAICTPHPRCMRLIPATVPAGNFLIDKAPRPRRTGPAPHPDLQERVALPA